MASKTHTAPKAPASRPAGKAYTAPGITVFFDKKRCIHFGACVRGLPEVFDTERKPWIKPEEATIRKVTEVVRRCPSGALHYVLDNGPAEKPEPATVEPRPNGPLFVRGALRIATRRGVVEDTRAALCRCGASQNKPFCDDSHDDCGFRAAGTTTINPWGKKS